jgi:hypothetical protein
MPDRKPFRLSLPNRYFPCSGGFASKIRIYSLIVTSECVMYKNNVLCFVLWKELKMTTSTGGLKITISGEPTIRKRLISFPGIKQQTAVGRREVFWDLVRIQNLTWFIKRFLLQ